MGYLGKVNPSHSSSSPGGTVMLVRSRMTSRVHTVSPDTTIAEALTITRAHRIRHLPVMAAEELVGLVTDRDLRLAMPPIWAAEREEMLAALNHRRVGEVMVTAIITTAPETPLEDAARQLYTHRIGCLPVMQDDRLIGILTETDVLRAFAELFASDGDTARVEVQMPNRPGELARIVRLIGIEHRVNIVGMVVPPLETTDQCKAILHLQAADPSAVVNALRKLGYRVGVPSLETDPDVDFIPTQEVQAPGQVDRGRAYAEL
jgi:acetoin utilization protein AcuB